MAICDCDRLGVCAMIRYPHFSALLVLAWRGSFNSGFAQKDFWYGGSWSFRAGLLEDNNGVVEWMWDAFFSFLMDRTMDILLVVRGGLHFQPISTVPYKQSISSINSQFQLYMISHLSRRHPKPPDACTVVWRGAMTSASSLAIRSHASTRQSGVLRLADGSALRATPLCNSSPGAAA
jgi:hypothetical protein